MMVTAASRDPNAPIGVFDSGIGGLTVVRELLRQVPNEHIVYFGDTARVPYGPKSAETVTRFSMEICTFLLEQGVKAIVIACNTSTAQALDTLRASFSVPIVGVIEPGAYAAARTTKTGRIGVLGTLGTVRSRAYDRAIHACNPDIEVTGKACPLFVPLAEEGWLDHEATRLIAHEYMKPVLAANVDTVVLGCTHYPLLRPMIQDALGPLVMLVDSAEQTATETGILLQNMGLANPGTTPPTRRFIASDLPDQFLQVGQRFLGAAIDRVETITLG